MSAEKWFEGRMAGFDLESTGTNVHEDRIITAALVYTAPDARPRSTTWIIDPGIDIPADAAAVHGWTRDRILTQVGAENQALRVTTNGRTMRMPRDAALFELAGFIGQVIHLEIPLVAANASYDLSLLETELVRNHVDTLSSRPAGIRGVVDPMVLDHQWDPYRKNCYRHGPDGTACDRENGVHVCGGCRGGKHPCGGCGVSDRKLSSLCRHYGVVLSSAHAADADALAAARLAARMGRLWRDAGRLRLSTLHTKQIEWRRDQMFGLRQWFDKNGKHDAAAQVCEEWPLHTRCARQAVAS